MLLAELIDEGKLLDSSTIVRTLRLSRGESTWLRGTHLLRQAADVLAGIHRLARGIQIPGVQSRKA